MFEQRCQNKAPLIITTQIAGEELTDKLSFNHPELRSTAEAIVRRIRDYCVAVDFEFNPDDQTPEA